MSTDDFFEKLPHFTDFSSLTDEKYYFEAPDDWYVVITDVKDSTKAIESGRYRDINTIGAARIIVVQNAVKNFAFPFAFGGDGASILIPSKWVDEVARSLIGLQKLAKIKFGLELRVGMVPVKEIRNSNGVILVGKFAVNPNKFIAFFKGGGISLAEKLIKNGEGSYHLKGDASVADLDGLSCRWQPIKSKRGEILSILIRNRETSDFSELKSIVEELERIFGGRIENANPVETKLMKYKGFIQCFRDEIRYSDGVLSNIFLKRLVVMIFAVFIFRFKFPALGFSRNEYLGQLSGHSDFRKFDEVVRLVVDCTNEQANQISIMLNRKYLDRKIFYGLFSSDTSLMTCFVRHLEAGGHIHFIDGGDGGYAMAAKQLKEQINQEAEKKRPSH
jgi:hypothetical protein